MDDERVHPLWLAGDRDGYIDTTLRLLRSGSGSPMTKPVASRWFNLNTILRDTAGDLWIHREKDELWWTTSYETTPDVELIDDPLSLPGSARIFVYYKRCSGWMNCDRTLDVASRFGGVSRRAIEKAVKKGPLQAEGERQNRRISVESLLKYFPPEKNAN
jgi:hypothetical protein